jgi:hypothetical protein
MHKCHGKGGKPLSLQMPFLTFNFLPLQTGDPDHVWCDGVEFGDHFGIWSLLSTFYPNVFCPDKIWLPIRRILVCK